uniref:Ig-like domain-containing protein n=1 Tax=Nitratireductor aquibiodomus TaxID=204799 RepID=UPI00055EDB39
MASQDRTNTTDDRKIATEQSADDRLNQLEQTALQVAQNDSAGEPVPVDPAAGQPTETSAAPDVPETVTPDADNIVRLPEGVSIDEIKLDGDNLILVQPDGSSITILNAALRIPTFLIGDVEIPELALTAALQANGIDVAAGPDGALTVVSATSQSGGGNFTTPNAGIGDAGPVIDLLPPTALQFGALERRELFPALREDRENDIPELSIVSIGTPPGEVNESALASGSGGGTTATAGNILVDPGNDGLASLVVTNVGGLSVDVTGGGRVDGTYGTLFVTPNGDGTYRFEYVLSQNTTDHDGPGKTGGDDVVRDVFKFVVTDGNGDTATDNLTITITDDGPIAVDDTDTIAAGAFGPVAGNLITDAEANGDNGADTPGADGASVSSVTATTAEGPASAVGTDTVVEGLYGVLTISADGSYSYARNPGTAGGVQDVFTYTLKDGDGDTDTATLTIDIGDASVEIRTPGVEEDGTIVFERGLAERGAEPAGSGESADGDGTNNDDPSEATSGTVTFTAPDGVQSVSVAGTALALGDPFPQTVSSDATGTLVVTGYSYNAVTGQGSISYSYTLTDNTLADPDGVSFGVTVTDADGDSQSGTIDIAIIDDAPVAV